MFLFDIVAPLTVAEAKTDYSKRRQRERDVDAGKPVAKQRTSKQTDYQKKRAQDKKEMELGEQDPCWKDYKQVGMKTKGGKQVPNCVPKESSNDFMANDSTSPVGGNTQNEDSWHDGDNAWSSDQHEMVEFAPSPEREDDEVPDQILKLANRWWNAGDKQPQITNVLRSLGWSIAQVESEDDAVQMMHDDGTTYFISADEFDPDVFEGWSNKMVARRTGQAPTPYSVYIQGKEWKSFPDDDHAENVANKLRAKFKQEGRDPSVITIAATGYDKDIKEMDSQGYTGTRDDYEQDSKYKGPVGKGTPVTAKKAVSDMAKDLDSAFNTPEQLKKDADYRAYRKGVKASRKQPPTPLPESDKYEPAPDLIDLDSIPGLNLGGSPKPKSRLGQGGNRAIQAPDKVKTQGQINNFKDRLKQKLSMDEEVSRLSDEEYNRVAAYVKKKYPGTQLSGLGRNPDGSFNVMIDSGSGRHEFKVRFHEPEETKLDELSPQTLRSYIKKSKGHSQKYDQKGNKADEKGDEELANKMWNKGDNRYAGAEQARAKLAGVNENTNYWTKLQNERNTKLNSLVNELKESVKK